VTTLANQTAQTSPAPASPLKPLTGLLLGMFVAMLASTVVSTSLPVILADLGGGQAAYTWVVTATLLTTAVSTPIWGKLADLFNRKLLLQVSLVLFIAASAAAGFAQDPNGLIACRAVQGIGAGGLGALTQIVMADIISPRDRGKYMGLFGAVMALATVGGPLIGGVITDTASWRFNFFVAVPVAAVSLVITQKTLRLPELPKRKVSIDYAGIVLLSASMSSLLIWISLAGSSFAWVSATTAVMVGGAVAGLVAFVAVELRATEPLLPLSLFRNRTFAWAVVASMSVGVGMFGTIMFLSQYLQLARGASATQSGMMELPMMAGMLIVSTVAGRQVTKTGVWKPYVVAGAALLTAGIALMGTIEYDTNFALVSVYMFVLGAGIGLLMQNLVLVVQNAVPVTDLGVASSGVNFFRTVGGTVGVAVLGAVLSNRVSTHMGEQAEPMRSALGSLGARGRDIAADLASGTIPAVKDLPAPVRVIVESVYGDAVSDIFMTAAPVGLLTILAAVMLPNLPLGTQTRHEKLIAVDVPHPDGPEVALAATAEAVAGQSGPEHPGDGRDHH
jgi:EmrB/QacA subfamily drug resistance transporter